MKKNIFATVALPLALTLAKVEDELSGDDLAKFTGRHMKIAARMATTTQ